MRMKGCKISETDYQKIIIAEKKTQNKRLSKKLMVLIHRFSGKGIEETAKETGYSISQVKRLTAEYKKVGLEEFLRCKYEGHHRTLSIEEEKEILSRFEKKAEAGQIVTAQEIKKEFDKRIGKDTGRCYIYMLLARHQWRKVMPRAKHPKKADEAAINASKKLTIT